MVDDFLSVTIAAVLSILYVYGSPGMALESNENCGNLIFVFERSCCLLKFIIDFVHISTALPHFFHVYFSYHLLVLFHQICLQFFIRTQPPQI